MKSLYSLLLLPVLGFGLATMEAERDLADKVTEGHRSRCSRQYHRHHSARGVRATLCTARPEHHRGEPRGRRRDNRAKADPDGYTILAYGSALTISPSLYPNLGYHPSRDFVAVVPFGISPNVLVVPPARGWKTGGELVAEAKSRPGALNFSWVGIGSVTHMRAERFRRSVGWRPSMFPFKGGAEAMTEVIAGRIDFFFGPVALVLPQNQEGKLTALALNGARCSAVLPSVPTTLEVGVADAEYPIWLGLFLPAKTPRHIVDKLSRETLKALQEPKVGDKVDVARIRADGHDLR